MRGIWGKPGKRKSLVILVSIILLLCICLGVYLINRRIHLSNNDLLMRYESREPVDIVEETVDGIVYTDYIFGEDTGRVIVENGGEDIVIRDNRHGFIKEYRHHVLYMAYDYNKGELFAEIKSYLKPAFWLWGTQKITQRISGDKRTDEECRQLGQWLSEGQYERITQSRKNEIIVTDSGTYFIN